jgi:hypothetical protein
MNKYYLNKDILKNYTRQQINESPYPNEPIFELKTYNPLNELCEQKESQISTELGNFILLYEFNKKIDPVPFEYLWNFIKDYGSYN